MHPSQTEDLWKVVCGIVVLCGIRSNPTRFIGILLIASVIWCSCNSTYKPHVAFLLSRSSDEDRTEKDQTEKDETEKDQPDETKKDQPDEDLDADIGTSAKVADVREMPRPDLYQVRATRDSQKRLRNVMLQDLF